MKSNSISFEELLNKIFEVNEQVVVNKVKELAQHYVGKYFTQKGGEHVYKITSVYLTEDARMIFGYEVQGTSRTVDSKNVCLTIKIA